MILITGATGHLGKSVLQFLRRKDANIPVAALVRDAAKAGELRALNAEIREGDYNHSDSLVRAFRGVDRLLFVSGNDLGNRLTQQANVVNAAKAAGVKHILYTSFQRKTEDLSSSPIVPVAESHLDTEKRIKASGLAYTILKNALYTDVLPWFLGEKVIESGRVWLPAGQGKTSFAAREDMAEAIANILAGSGHENKTYEIAAPVSVSMQEIAAYLSEIAGKPVIYADSTRETFLAEAEAAGVPAPIAGMQADFCEGIRRGEFDLPSADLETLLGRKLLTVKEYLQSVYAPVNA